ncbi:MAG: hypothetical protein ACK4YO_01340, partial [Candidatus Altarchaeaceae archaeon]
MKNDKTEKFCLLVILSFFVEILFQPVSAECSATIYGKIEFEQCYYTNCGAANATISVFAVGIDSYGNTILTLLNSTYTDFDGNYNMAIFLNKSTRISMSLYKDPYNISMMEDEDLYTISCNENLNVSYSIKFCGYPLVFQGRIVEKYNGEFIDVNESMIDENITIHIENIPKDGNFSFSNHALTKSDEKGTAYSISIQTYENWTMQVYLWAEPTKEYYYRVRGHLSERKLEISGECSTSSEPIEKDFFRFKRKNISESCNYDDECKSNYCENKICAILQLNNITNSTIDNISNISSSTVIYSNLTNSNISNSNVAGSTINNSNIINSSISYSNITNSTLVNSNIINSLINISIANNSYILNSTINNTLLPPNSNITNAIITNNKLIYGTLITSDGTNLTVNELGTYINGTFYNVPYVIIYQNGTFALQLESNTTGSIITNSTIINSNATYSNITNSTINFSNINNSNISNSDLIHSNITNSNISNSNVAGSTINNSHLTNSNITNAISIKSLIINSSVENSIANASTITNYSLVGNSNINNSNISNSAVTHSNVSNSNIINNSFIANSTLLNATTSNSTIYNSNLTNSEISGLNIVNSNISNSNIKFLHNAIIENASIENNVLYNGIIHIGNFTYSVNSSGTYINNIYYSNESQLNLTDECTTNDNCNNGLFCTSLHKCMKFSIKEIYPDNEKTFKNNLTINISFEGAVNSAILEIIYPNASSENISLNISHGYAYYILQNQSQGIYKFKICITDVFNHSICSYTRNFTLNSSSIEINYLSMLKNNEILSKDITNFTIIINSSENLTSAWVLITGDLINGSKFTKIEYLTPEKDTFSTVMNIENFSDGNYTFNVCANDTQGNIGCAGERKIIIDKNPPNILFFNVSTGTNSALIIINYSEISNTSFCYGKENLSNCIAVDFSEISTIYITNLQPNTTYTFNLTFCDRANNCNSTIGNFTTKEIDTTKPQALIYITNITNISASIMINFTEKSNITLRYGTNQTSLQEEISNSSYSLTHNLNLQNLNKGTTYYYVVIFCDDSN